MAEFFEGLAGLMQFTSVLYLAFLAFAVIIYFVLPGPRSRAGWLLTLSALFYLLLSPEWFWVLLAVTAFTYVVGIVIETSQATRNGVSPTPREKLALAAGIIPAVGALVLFKYLGFLAEVGNGVLQVLPAPVSIPVLKLALPIGISFWTFQTIAYLVDVYRGTTRAERNPLYYALMVMFFPVVTAGPITRAQTLLPQLKRQHRFDYHKMQSGLLLIGRGFFKKLMVADRLAVFVDSVFSDPYQHAGTVHGLLFTVAAVFFAGQLYCDFSGYTDIVRGSARLFGVELPVNFRAPYLAVSVRDFWRRWHITLMDWLRDYVYIPLGGNRKGRTRRVVNVMAVFLVSGLWHGAGLNFLVWGGLNGLYMIVGDALSPLRARLAGFLRVDRSTAGHRMFQTLVTFGLITLAWVFFRADSLADAIYIIPRMFIPTLWIFSDGTMLQQGLSYSELVITFVSVTLIWVGDWLSMRRDLFADLRRQPLYVRWAIYYALVFAVAIFGHYGEAYNAADFVYFKF
ncbi:MAG TPA: membrane-bound O-acyltransferase family protein [Coriobacteriia bacterium]|nr:membrane-bound O-acyltransferase family protein [Coriobacteriia bacterium]